MVSVSLSRIHLPELNRTSTQSISILLAVARTLQWADSVTCMMGMKLLTSLSMCTVDDLSQFMLPAVLCEHQPHATCALSKDHC